MEERAHRAQMSGCAGIGKHAVSSAVLTCPCMASQITDETRTRSLLPPASRFGCKCAESKRRVDEPDDTQHQKKDLVSKSRRIDELKYLKLYVDDYRRFACIGTDTAPPVAGNKLCHPPGWRILC